LDVCEWSKTTEGFEIAEGERNFGFVIWVSELTWVFLMEFGGELFALWFCIRHYYSVGEGVNLRDEVGVEELWLWRGPENKMSFRYFLRQIVNWKYLWEIW
jgi:hypothetical protein